MQRPEPSLIDFEAEPIVPSVRNIEEPRQGLSARLTRDETRYLVDETRQPIRENRNLGNQDNFNNRVLNDNAPPLVPRVNFALSSTARANVETHAPMRFEQELNDLAYSLESSRLDNRERIPKVSKHTYVDKGVPQTVIDMNRDEQRQNTQQRTNINSTYTPPFSLAGLPTRNATFQLINTETNRNRNETATLITPQNFSHNPDARDICRPTFTTPWLLHRRKIIRDWKIKFKGGSDSRAEGFLCRIEECRNDTGLTDSDLLEALPDLLDGMAAKWAHLQKHKWQSWSVFVTDFRKNYGDPHFQIRVQHETRLRTQEESEPIIDFITNYRHILKYLYPQPPLEDQVSMTYNNLKPIYRDKINRRSVLTFRDLELFGKESRTRRLLNENTNLPHLKNCHFYRNWRSSQSNPRHPTRGAGEGKAQTTSRLWMRQLHQTNTRRKVKMERAEAIWGR